MDILIFDVKGQMAHFRKFYTNSSSLSYSVPTRTNIIGFIASILGKDRDTYYEEFSVENCNIALRKMNKTRRIMQTLNYIKTDSTGNLYNMKNHTQVPFEIIMGEEGEIIYRIYFNHNNNNLMNELEERLKNKKYFYAPFLGAAPFNCHVDFVDRIDGIENNGEIEISSLIDCDKVDDINIDFLNTNLFLMKEKMPCDFNKDRTIRKISSYIYDENCSSIKVNVKEKYITVDYNKEKENIIFM